MREPGRILLSLSLGVSLLPLFASGQDTSAPSLGDISRQTRQQRQNNGPQSPKPTKVFGDDDVATPRSDSDQISRVGNQAAAGNVPASKDAKKLTAERWKARILAQKNQIVSIQTSIDQLSQSIYFHSSSQVRWNERQREKQQQVERLQTQLEEQKKHLEEMQEQARRQGYGNAVYDP